MKFREHNASTIKILVNLEEILHNKDHLYDPDVVNACLKVFYEKGFVFKEMEQSETFFRVH